MTATLELAPGHLARDTHTCTAGGDTLPPTIQEPTPKVDPSAATNSDPGHRCADAKRMGAGADLAFACASLSDVESARMAIANRIGALEREVAEAGALAVLDSTEFKRATALHDALVAVEKQAIKDVERAIKAHPYGAWIASRKGIGAKQGARLLAAIGDPLWNDAEDRPRRGCGELLQYSGHGDPARSRRRKGEKVQFNPEVKMRAHLCAVSCLKQMDSPFRPAYDGARAAWADRDVIDGHKHNHALRVVGREILKDLWNFARALPQKPLDTNADRGEGAER